MAHGSPAWDRHMSFIKKMISTFLVQASMLISPMLSHGLSQEHHRSDFHHIPGLVGEYRNDGYNSTMQVRSEGTQWRRMSGTH